MPLRKLLETSQYSVVFVDIARRMEAGGGGAYLLLALAMGPSATRPLRGRGVSFCRVWLCVMGKDSGRTTRVGEGPAGEGLEKVQ